ERVGKWLRRHPRATSSGSVATVAIVLLAAGAAALFGIRDRLESAQARECRQAFEAGTTRALCLVNTTSEVQDHLRAGRAVCEETLNLYQVLDRVDWQRQALWRRLAPEDRQRLAEDVR